MDAADYMPDHLIFPSPDIHRDEQDLAPNLQLLIGAVAKVSQGLSLHLSG